MAASPVLTSNYNGDVLDYIITEAVVGNEAVDKGSVYVIPDVPSKISIGKMVSTANPIIDREAMPTTKSATVTWSESTLTPAEMMIYIPDINPRIFEAAWREFQPKGALPNKVLDPNIQKVFADIVLKQAAKQVGKLLWQGDNTLAASNPLHFFNGYFTRAAASSTNIDVTNIGTITTANVQTILENCLQSVPDALYDDKDVCFHMNTGDFRKYQSSVRQLSYKGQGPADSVPAEYGGKEIRYYSQAPANKILVCRASTGPESNFYAACDRVNDMENFIIEKLRPEGEHYFLKALFKMDANFSIDSESVYYAGS
jgi:hypothetical protein